MKRLFVALLVGFLTVPVMAQNEQELLSEFISTAPKVVKTSIHQSISQLSTNDGEQQLVSESSAIACSNIITNIIPALENYQTKENFDNPKDAVDALKKYCIEVHMNSQKGIVNSSHNPQEWNNVPDVVRRGYGQTAFMIQNSIDLAFQFLSNNYPSLLDRKNIQFLMADVLAIGLQQACEGYITTETFEVALDRKDEHLARRVEELNRREEGLTNLEQNLTQQFEDLYRQQQELEFNKIMVNRETEVARRESLCNSREQRLHSWEENLNKREAAVKIKEEELARKEKMPNEKTEKSGRKTRGRK